MTGEEHDRWRDERNHMEGLLNQRLNYYILFFGATVTVIYYLKSEWGLMLILFLSSFTSFYFTLLIGRALRRLIINNQKLTSFENDPTQIIADLANKGEWWQFNKSVIKWMIAIPVAGTTLLVALFIVVLLVIVLSRSEDFFKFVAFLLG